jgi:type III secretion protein L
MTLAWIDPRALTATPSRVVKRADYESLVEAEAVLAEARRAALTQAVELEVLRAKAQAAGLSAGFDAGREAWAQHLLKQHQQQGAQLEDLSGSIVSLVINTIQHLLGEIPEAERFERLAEQVLGSALQARRVRLVVASADAEAAHALLGRWAHEREPGLQLDVLVDPALETGDCVLETDLGAVDGRLSQRLKSIEAALQARLGDAT